jgi:hypothetical protein
MVKALGPAPLADLLGRIAHAYGLENGEPS